jgi:putative ABC transport system permease protein
VFRVALKGLVGHKLRFALTTLAVVLGVTFVAGAFVLTDSMERAFDELFASSYGAADVVVRARAGYDLSVADWQVGAGATLDEEVLDDIAAVDGVEAVEGGVEGWARFLDPDGEPIVTQAPNLVFTWTERANPLVIRDGRAPTDPDDVTMDAGTFRRHGFALGDAVRLATEQGVTTHTLVGVTGFGDSDNMLGATIATMPLARGQELFGKKGALDEVSVLGDGTVDATVLRERIAAALGDDVEVTTAADAAADGSAEVAEALGFFSTALLAFAAIALFVGSFLIANTFAIVVAQRAREFALLRAVGASRRQVRTAVLGEALLVGAVAATVGLALGIALGAGLPSLFAALGVDLPTGDVVVAPRTVVAAYVVGVVVTVLAALLPARRASQVAPVEALRDAVTSPSAALHRRTLAGGVLVVVGALALGVGLSGAVGNPLAVVGVGAAAAFVGVALLAPLLAEPLARTFGALPARISVAGRVARGNARRDPRRTASTASALMIGLALVSAVSILAASVQGAVGDALSEQLRADFIVNNGGGATPQVPLPPALATGLRDAPAIGATTPVQLAQVSDGEQVLSVVGVDVAVSDELLAIDPREGDLTTLGADDIALVDDLARERGLALGDPFEVTFLDGRSVSLTVAATFGSSELIGTGYLVDLTAMDEHAGAARIDLLVLADARGDLDAARAALEEAVAIAPGATVRDQAEFRQTQQAAIDQVLGLMLVLLALAVLIALLGITNTLALAVIERTREIGLLRAVGMTRRQTRRMVLWESVLVSAFGAVLGVGVGSVLGWALVRALADQGVQRLVVPGGQLAVYAVVAVLAGIVAAALPAWRAARLDVLRAVTVE